MKRKLPNQSSLEQNHDDQQPEATAQEVASSALKGMRELYEKYAAARNKLSLCSWQFDQYYKKHSAAMTAGEQEMFKESAEVSAQLMGGILDPVITTIIDQLKELVNLLNNPNPNTVLNSNSCQDVSCAQIEDTASQAQLPQPPTATCPEVALLAEPSAAATDTHGHH